ncbi:MAG: glycosyltransferase family 2 protein [Bryobacteraceae bacterium]|nr:glycosyltransferase family 2 protein [Bryobacteraceae bacterium]MDW8378061.1 glycosyltransferase family 2 protein [Bryobacterales bacterium]
MVKVSAIIPTWNRRDLLVSLLENLRLQTQPFAEILVVDNGSSDGSAQAARQRGARVIELASNRGFSFAVNRGIEASLHDWVAVLNNDVLLHPDWLVRLVDNVGEYWFATGKLLRASDPRKVDGTFDLLSRGATAWRAGHGRQDGPLWTEKRTIFFAPFTAALFRKEIFSRVGLLDEEFESYLEDVDFGLRCALGGYHGLYVPEATGRHLGGATLGEWNEETVRRLARNQLLLIAKHYPEGWIWQYGWAVLVAQSLWGAAAFKHGAGLAFLSGKWEALRRFGKVRRSGSKQIRQVLVSSEEEIRRLQAETGFDLYWKLYFRLT